MASTHELIKAAGTGAALWALGVGIVRALPQTMDGKLGTLLSYGAQIPAGWLTVQVLRLTTGCDDTGELNVMMSACATAAVIDGVVISFVPELYHPKQPFSAPAQRTGGTLLWALGWIMTTSAFREHGRR